MTRVIVDKHEPLSAAGLVFVGVGRDPQGAQVGFLSRVPPAAEFDAEPDSLLSLPDAWPVKDMLPTLAAWPAWRLAAAAGVELGSHVVVKGVGALAQSVRIMLTERGGVFEGSGAPDTMVVLENAGIAFGACLLACRTRGTVLLADPAAARFDLNFYPDAHRRGLRIIGVDLAYADVTAWHRVREAVRRTATRSSVPGR